MIAHDMTEQLELTQERLNALQLRLDDLKGRL
jgi:hypothetical protein